MNELSSVIKMNNIFYLINSIKSKDKKTRYRALDDIMKLSRSKKIKQKTELLKVLNEKSLSKEWEERYVSMYGISRFKWKCGQFKDLKEVYQNVLRLLEDGDGRVRVAAFNALDIKQKQFKLKEKLNQIFDALMYNAFKRELVV